MRLTKQIRRGIVYYGIRLFIFIFNHVPRNVALALGSGLGQFAWLILKRDKERIDKNLHIAYGTRFSAEERNEIGKQFFVNTGKNIVDIARFKKHLRTELLPLVEVVGKENLDAAFAKGKGLIGVTGHLGNFELLAAYIASTGHPIAVIGRELYDKRIDAVIVANRRLAGLTQFYTTDSPKKILAWLKNNGGLGILIDTDSDKVRSISVPLFGHPNNTPVGQSVFGLRTGTALLPMCCVRIADERYRVIIQPPVLIPDGDDFNANVFTITKACLHELEKMIDTYRDQWIWLHNRWPDLKPPET